MKNLYQWVDKDAALAEVCEHLAKQPAIAVDTEFVRSRTYYPHLGLLQLACGDRVFLVDPLSLTNTQPLANLFENPAVVKVIHSCSEDLEVFQYALGVLPQSLFDTQVAAAFAGYGLSIGYANLVKAIKDIDIPKHETRSDWLQRPLRDAQLQYAALDVLHLLDVYHTLINHLESQKRLRWVQADSQALVDKLRHTNHARDYYKRVKSAWKLTPRQLSVLQRLCSWRERQAREKDVPRGRILKDTTLYDLAFKLPVATQHLNNTKEFTVKAQQEMSGALLDVIQQGLEVENYPHALPRPLSIQQRHIVKQLKAQTASVAEAIHLPVELLVRKKDYEFLARLATSSELIYLPESLCDWREEVVGSRLLDLLASPSEELS